MLILAIGDIVGVNTIEYLKNNLPEYVKANKIDFVIANGENASEIKGLSSRDAEKILNAGVDFITLGNHAFGKKDLYDFLDSNSHLIIRPANFSHLAPGHGYSIININGYKILCINILGTVYLNPLNNPFETVDKILDRESGSYDFAILDIHAEATSEKVALGRYFDGRISVIFGTHTHIQTADETILPNGSGYITDLGMTGPVNGILGTKSELIIDKFTKQLPQYFAVADGEIKAHGAIFDVDTDTKKVVEIKRIVF